MDLPVRALFRVSRRRDARLEAERVVHLPVHEHDLEFVDDINHEVIVCGLVDVRG